MKKMQSTESNGNVFAAIDDPMATWIIDDPGSSHSSRYRGAAPPARGTSVFAKSSPLNSNGSARIAASA